MKVQSTKHKLILLEGIDIYMQFISKTAIHSAGKGMFPIYRIPGMIVTAKNTIITYCEGREGRSDWSAGGIISRRSEDEGVTWSEEKCIAADKNGESVNNPIMIASKDGTVHFLWQTKYIRTFYQKSTDDGKSFSQPREITSVFDDYITKHNINWNVYALGPGHGIELENKRLIIPVWVAFGKGTEHGPACVSVIYSDDGGDSFKAGDIVPWDENCPNMNETAAVELSDGSVMLNIRNHSDCFLRATSISKNGYDGFSNYKLEKELPDPICFGSIVGHKDENEHCLYFSNCSVLPSKENFYSRERKNLTVKMSRDDGQSWGISRQLELRSGYSDIAVSCDGKWIYCYYEHDCAQSLHSEPRHMTFAKFNREWLED